MAASKCSSCDGELAASGAKCPRCGWDGGRLSRRCLRCDDVVKLGPDTARLKVPAGAALVVAGVAGFLGGFLGSLAIFTAAAAVGSVIMMRTLRYRCTGCGALVPDSLVSTAEREATKSASTGYAVRGVLFGLGALVAFGVWIAILARTSDAEEDPLEKAKASASASALGQEELGSDVESLEAQVKTNVVLDAKAAEKLLELGEPGIAALVRLLDEKDVRVIRIACLSLAKAGEAGKDAVPRLITILETHEDRFVRRDAIGAVAAMGPHAQPAEPVLEKLAAGKDGAGARDALKRLRSAK